MIVRNHVRLVVLFALVVAALGPAAMSRAQVVQLGDDTARSEVIAQGTAELPADEVAWTASRIDAEPIEDAPLRDQALGFVVADDVPVVVSDLTTGEQALLGVDEAAFFGGGTQQQVASLGDERGTYVQIRLAAAQAATTEGDGDLLFGGDEFDAPAGTRDINLLAATLGPNDSLSYEVEAGSALVLVLSGMVEVGSGGTLGAAEASEFDDEIEIANDGDEEARVVIAAIGAEVPPLPTFTGTVTLDVRACPEGATRTSFDPASCRTVGGDEGFAVNLLDANNQFIPTNDDLADGSVTWTDLPFGTYLYAQPTLPSPYGSTLWTDADAVPLQIAQASPDVANPDINHILFVFEIGSGSITVEVRACPEGVTPDDLDGADCEIADPASGFAARITTPDGGTLTLADAFVDGGRYVFGDLELRPAGTSDADPAGIYTVDLVTLPDGATTYAIVAGGVAADPGEAAGVVLTQAAPNQLVTIYTFPEEEAPPADEGSVVIQVFGCPEGVTRNDSEEFDSCSFIQDGFGVVLVTPDGSELTLADAAIGGDGFVWPGLETGTYSFGLTELPEGFVDALAPGYPSSPDNASRVDVVVSEDNPDPVVRVFVFRSTP